LYCGLYFLRAAACNAKRVFATVEASFHLSVRVLLGLSPFVPGYSKLLAVHLQLRRGFCRPSPYWAGLWPFDPVLTEVSADRPRHRPRFSFVPGFDRGSRRLSPASAGFLPSAFDPDRGFYTVRHRPWQASRRPPASSGAYAVRPRPRRASRRPSPFSSSPLAVTPGRRPGRLPSFPVFDITYHRPSRFSAGIAVGPSFGVVFWPIFLSPSRCIMLDPVIFPFQKSI